MVKGEFAPSEQTKAEEKLILPEPKTTYEKIAYALPNNAATLTSAQIQFLNKFALKPALLFKSADPGVRLDL